MLNEVRLIGNLGRDPEGKDAGGAAVATLSVATSRKWTDKQGQQKEDTQWHRVVCWGRLAETCTAHLRKGRQVYVAGRLQTREWEKDGKKQWTTEVIADRVLFLGGKDDAGGRDGPAYDSPDEPLPF